MRRYLLGLILLLIAASMFLTACKDENNPTDPEDALWAVILTKNDDVKDDVYDIMISWVGTGTYEEPESLELEIEGEDIALESWQDIWFGSANLLAGQQYNIKLMIDGDVQCDANLRIVYPVTGSFPEFYNPTMSSTMTWSLYDDNEEQVASLSSVNMENIWEDDDYYETSQLSPSARSFTFPANAVDDFGTATQFTMDITQLNVNTVNDVMLMSGHSAYQSYGYGSKQERGRTQILNHYRKLINQYR